MTKSIPLLGEPHGSTSTPSENKEHEDATLVVKDFAPLSELPSIVITSLIWAKLRNNAALSWGSESDIQKLVSLVIEDAIASAGLDKELACYSELGVKNMRPDIWVVVNKFGIPIGVIEVKKPGVDIMESKRVHGQIYDYMLRLRHFYGQQNVFGIVSTYKQWRIYWLQDCNSSATATKIDNSLTRNANIEKPNVIPTISSSQTDNQPDKECPPTPEKRVVYGSEIIEWNSLSLPKILVSVILKMYYSPNFTVPLINPKRSYIILNTMSWYWGFLPPTFNKLNYDIMPKLNTQNLFLLMDLKGGLIWYSRNH
jgi:hypothetical protein